MVNHKFSIFIFIFFQEQLTTFNFIFNRSFKFSFLIPELIKPRIKHVEYGKNLLNTKIQKPIKKKINDLLRHEIKNS